MLWMTGKLNLPSVRSSPHALVRRVLLGGQVDVVVADLEDEPDEVDERHAVELGLGRVRRLACISLIPSRNSPRLVAHHLQIVLLGGQVRVSRQNRSMPCRGAG